MSANLRHQKSLRTKQEITTEVQQKCYEVGSIIANIHLMHKNKHDILLQIERLNKEQARQDLEETKTETTPETQPTQ
jgi:hypothetical protein